MKHKSYILLLLASVIILTSMSECKFTLNPWMIEHSYVTVDLNGRHHVSTVAEAFGGAAHREPTLWAHLYDEYFYFRVERQLFSGENSVWLTINYKYLSQLKPNKKYDLMAGDTDIQPSSVTSSGYEYYLTEGSLMFTSYVDGNHFAGTFEFAAYNQELDSTIVATNGTFEFAGTESDTSWDE